jgi:aldehyde dehydrogenase (NAD+)
MKALFEEAIEFWDRTAAIEPPQTTPGFTVLPTSPSWNYAPVPEKADHFAIRPRYDLFIDGEWQAPKDGKRFATINRATEEKLAEVIAAGSKDVDRAVAAARKAFDETWRKLPGTERAKYVFRIARSILGRSRELAVLESRNGGNDPVMHRFEE